MESDKRVCPVVWKSLLLHFLVTSKVELFLLVFSINCISKCSPLSCGKVVSNLFSFIYTFEKTTGLSLVA